MRAVDVEPVGAGVLVCAWVGVIHADDLDRDVLQCTEISSVVDALGAVANDGEVVSGVDVGSRHGASYEVRSEQLRCCMADISAGRGRGWAPKES